MKELCLDWGEFLSDYDLIWKPMPALWKDAALSGNGLLGFTVYKERLSKRSIRVDIGRSDVVDHRENEPVTEGKARLPVGKMELVTRGEILDSEMRLCLWDAEIRIRLKTTQGVVAVRCLTHARENFMLFEVTASEGEMGCSWVWYPGLAVSPRKLKNNEPFKGGMNPFPVYRREGDIDVCLQSLLAGGEYATAWRVSGEGGRTCLSLSVGNSRRMTEGVAEAVEHVRRSLTRSFSEWVQGHQRWWHAFYAGDSEDTGSFLSVPDARLEGFYWIQLYKLASATRADRPAVDLMGPWFQMDTPWPAIWWNLNIQLTYWPAYASNHLELGESLCRMLDRNIDNLTRNVPEEFQRDSAAIGRVSSYDCRSPVGMERCDLPWACHNYWLQCRYAMDDGRMRDGLFPLLRRSINYYIHLLEKGADGRLHLPESISPEYPKTASDCNIDLALLRWGCRTLLEISRRFGLKDEREPTWENVLKDLAAYPSDENGLMIGAGVPLTQSHRHYSHLLMIYPLGLLNAEQPESRELIDRSLRRWMGLQGLHRGYSYTGASAISSRMGRGNDALAYLNRFLRQQDFPVTQNTMYLEAGPVMETPLSAASSLHEMLLQSWGDKIRVFPAVPDEWPDVSFTNLRAEGAFLVDAVRRGGRTLFVRVKSLAGSPCELRTDIRSPRVRVDGCETTAFPDENGCLRIDMRKSQTAVVSDGGLTDEDFAVRPVEVQYNICYHYGNVRP